MTQEEKSLLLKELCAKLPYEVKVKTPYNDATLIGLIKRKGFKKDEYYIDAITDKQTYPVRYIQSYLRPMSSMTEEEKKEISILLNYEFYIDDDYALVAEDNRHRIRLDLMQIYIDYLNAHHFDYCGLIERGLAIEVTEDNNPYKE